MKSWMTSLTLVAMAALVTACASGGESETAQTTEMGSAGRVPDTSRMAARPAAQDQEQMAVRDSILPEWESTIEPTQGYGVNGEAALRALPGNRTFVSVELSDGNPGDQLPWHVHVGTCGSGGSVYGDPSAYPVMTVGADGSAHAEATISKSLAAGDEYYINIHKSPSEMQTIVACGGVKSK